MSAALTAFDDHIVYVDESGDHSLKRFDPDFPVFVLTFCIFRKEDYSCQIVPALQRIKFKHFGHDMVIFHERDIRKASGPFEFLTDEERRSAFMADLNDWVEQSPFAIIAVVIRKREFAEKHTDARNPYHFAMLLGLERVEKYLRKARVKHTRKTAVLTSGDLLRLRKASLNLTHIVFEARGKREDDELELEFRRVCDGENFRRESLPFQMVLAAKQINSCGLQLADLTARPVGRHVMNPGQPNRAFEIIQRKLDRSPSGEIEGYGLKTYP